jgi:hypothetical protein
MGAGLELSRSEQAAHESLGRRFEACQPHTAKPTDLAVGESFMDTLPIHLCGCFPLGSLR